MSQRDEKTGKQPRCPAHRRDFAYDAIWRSGLESTPKPWSCHLNVGWIGEAKLGACNAEVSHIWCKDALGNEEPWLGIIEGLFRRDGGRSMAERPLVWLTAVVLVAVDAA